jgi:hypothetical protein
MDNNAVEILVIQDRSGSMGSVRDATIEGFNAFLADQKATPGTAILSLVQFDDNYEQPHDRKLLTEVPPLTRETYVPRWNTALYDAACRSIDELGEKLARLPEDQRPGQVVVVIQTDGEENSSFHFNLSDLKERIQKQTNVYNWKFMFFGANIDAYAVAGSFGIAPTLTANYSGDMETTKSLYMVSSASINRGRKGQCMDFTQDEIQSLVQGTAAGK